MRKKIFLAIFFMLIASMLCISVIIIAISFNEYVIRLNEDLNIELRFLSIADDIDELKSISLNGRRITLISPDGSVLFDSDADESTLENHLDRNEVKTAFSSGTGYAMRSSSTIGKKYIYQAMLLPDGNVLRLSTPANTVVHFVSLILWPFLTCLCLMLLIALVLASYISKKITYPINTLDLDNPENIEGYPELSPLLIRISQQKSIIQKHLEDAERKAYEFMLITNNMREGIVVVDSNGKILSLNSATKKLFHNESILIGDSILHLSRASDFYAIVTSVLKGEAITRKLNENGKILEVIANPVSTNENSSGAVVLFIDVTEREKREQMRREFTANVSHELKTPLTVISGFAEIMKSEEIDSSSVKEYSKEIFSQTQRLISLVHDIIKISQLDEGITQKNFESVLISSLVSDVCKSLDLKLKEKKIHLTINVSEERTISGNASLLSELIYNLLDNAIRYNNDNGSISIDISSNSTCTSFAIKDSGIGIPDADLDRVFERFYRVDKGRSRESGGTGLGLSIVRHVAEYHGASIDIESKLGVGTEISVCFPNEAERKSFS